MAEGRSKQGSGLEVGSGASIASESSTLYGIVSPDSLYSKNMLLYRTEAYMQEVQDPLIRVEGFWLSGISLGSNHH